MKYKKSVYRSLAMVTQLGFCVLTPVFLGIFAGSYLDSRYGTHLTLGFLILGVLGGGRGAYAMAKRLIDQDAKEARIEREEQWKRGAFRRGRRSCRQTQAQKPYFQAGIRT